MVVLTLPPFIHCESQMEKMAHFEMKENASMSKESVFVFKLTIHIAFLFFFLLDLESYCVRLKDKERERRRYHEICTRPVQPMPI